MNVEIYQRNYDYENWNDIMKMFTDDPIFMVANLKKNVSIHRKIQLLFKNIGNKKGSIDSIKFKISDKEYEIN
ncbi:hypothetical protein [Tepidibacter sp. Z1-5]|uniref:hypothetical protein n=1 Tax=Tepidibacter sp. Z1-5 TaxID=3134138 RepID=UPI0030C2D7FD